MTKSICVKGASPVIILILKLFHEQIWFLSGVFPECILREMKNYLTNEARYNGVSSATYYSISYLTKTLVGSFTLLYKV